MRGHRLFHICSEHGHFHGANLACLGVSACLVGFYLRNRRAGAEGEGERRIGSDRRAGGDVEHVRRAEILGGKHALRLEKKVPSASSLLFSSRENPSRGLQEMRTFSLPFVCLQPSPSSNLAAEVSGVIEATLCIVGVGGPCREDAASDFAGHAGQVTCCGLWTKRRNVCMWAKRERKRRKQPRVEGVPLRGCSTFLRPNLGQLGPRRLPSLT